MASTSNTVMSFIASPSERSLVRQILAKGDPERGGTFTREVALKAFEDVKLPDEVLHEIWNIADDDNNGWLSERGLAIAVRLLGWAQKGEKVTEALIHRPGPLPIIGGIRDSFLQKKKSVLLKPKLFLVKPKHTRVQPFSGGILGGVRVETDVTEDQLMSALTPLTPHMAKYMSMFQRNAPRNGLVAEERARTFFAKSGLHAESLDKIWTLADTKTRGSLDFTDFAIAMHLIKASMDGQLPFIPTSLPPHLYEQASSLGAKISKDHSRTQFDILDKSLITADAEREALALKQGLAIRANNLLSPSANMKNDQGQLDKLNRSLVVANAEFKAPTVNQSTPAAQPPLLSTQTRNDKCQIDTLSRLLDASNAAKEELARAFASQETELVSLSAKSRNDQGLIDALNGSLATTNSAYEGARKVIDSQATGLAFLSAKTRNDQVQIDTLNRSLNAVEAENEELRRAAASQGVEFSSLSANSRYDKGQIDALNRSLTTERAEQEELRRAFTSLTAELQSLSSNTRNDHVQIDSLKQSLGTAYAEQEELRQSCTSQAAELLSLTAQMKTGEDQLHNLAGSFLKVREERDTIKQAFDSRSNELSVLSAETQDQRTQINALHTSLDTTTAELLDARNQLSSENAANATRTHMLDELREQQDGQINELHAFLDTTTAERETLREALSERAAELLSVQNQLSSANAANANRVSLVNELREQLNERTKELRSTSEELGRGRAKNDLNTSRHHATRSKTSELRVQTGIQIHTQQDKLEVPHLTHAQSTNAVAGPSRIPSHNTATYTKLHGTGRQPVRRRERIRCRFKCGVCMDEKPMDDVTFLDPCGHQFCRGCVKGYVGAKLDDRSFPILCPVCMTDGGRANPGMVTDAIVRQAGITEKQFNKWVELEIAQYAVTLHCRKCKSTFNVDKQDFQEIDDISCPFPRCNHTWCKLCQQSISPNGPKHSCDGLSEMKDLIKRSGWKYCPSCKTPIEKVSGCNHMTVCVYPTLEITEYQWLEKCTYCHTEFCYSCGGAYRSGHSCR